MSPIRRQLCKASRSLATRMVKRHWQASSAIAPRKGWSGFFGFSCRGGHEALGAACFRVLWAGIELQAGGSPAIPVRRVRRPLDTSLKLRSVGGRQASRDSFSGYRGEGGKLPTLDLDLTVTQSAGADAGAPSAGRHRALCFGSICFRLQVLPVHAPFLGVASAGASLWGPQRPSWGLQTRLIFGSARTINTELDPETPGAGPTTADSEAARFLLTLRTMPPSMLQASKMAWMAPMQGVHAFVYGGVRPALAGKGHAVPQWLLVQARPPNRRIASLQD